MKDFHELPKLRDGLSFLYIEHGRIEQHSLAVECVEESGRIPVPVAALGVLMLGPGTSITHAAMKTLTDNGCMTIWCGTESTRCYAYGHGETRKAYHLLKQAKMASDPVLRTRIVHRMYHARFGYRLPEHLTIEQLRGNEGVRVRDAYANASKEYGVQWNGRIYDRGNWDAADTVNRALSAANACLNGICHTAIISGGYSSALGFIHTGKQLSFVYDVADLYKVDITIPVAFKASRLSMGNLESEVRRECRSAFREYRLLERILPDIDRILDVSMDDPSLEMNLDEDGGLPTPLWSPEEEGKEE